MPNIFFVGTSLFLSCGRAYTLSLFSALVSRIITLAIPYRDWNLYA